MWLVLVRLRAATTEASWAEQCRVTRIVAIWFAIMLENKRYRTPSIFKQSTDNPNLSRVEAQVSQTQKLSYMQEVCEIRCSSNYMYKRLPE